MDYRQIEFLAENELISVIPRFTFNPAAGAVDSVASTSTAGRLPKLELICGRFGPFKAGDPVEIPLWLAVHLKQANRCSILPPAWLNVNQLEVIKSEEHDSPIFTKMPSPFYMNIVHLLLAHAPDDIPDGDEVKTLVKDIWDNRQAKLRSSVDVLLKSETSHAKVNNLTPLEIARVRCFLLKSLDHMHRLQTAIDDMFPGLSVANMSSTLSSSSQQ